MEAGGWGGVEVLCRCARETSFLCVQGCLIRILHNLATTLNGEYCTKKTCPVVLFDSLSFQNALLFPFPFFKIYRPLEWPRPPPRPPPKKKILVDTHVPNQVSLYSYFVKFQLFRHSYVTFYALFACLNFHKHVGLIRNCSYLILAEKINFWCQ